jgi:hypothetical protein
VLVRFDTHDRGVSHRSQSNAENVMDVGIKNLKCGARVLEIGGSFMHCTGMSRV